MSDKSSRCIVYTEFPSCPCYNNAEVQIFGNFFLFGDLDSYHTYDEGLSPALWLNLIPKFPGDQAR